jgi:hypothetical protein
LLISVPVKNFAYLVPPVFLLSEMMSPHGRVALRSILLLCFVAAVSSAAVLFDIFRGREMNVPGIFVGLLTYLPVVLFLCERCDRTIDEPTFQKLLRLSAWFVIVQSMIGFAQFALSRNPDAVAGTFGLLDFRTGGITIAQVYFTFTLFGLILFLFLDPGTVLAKAAIVIGLLACVLAQSGHQTIFFMASLGLFSLLRWNRPRTVLAVGAAIGLLLLAVVQFYPATLPHTRDWFRKVALSPYSPKRMAITEAAEIARDPKNLVLGTGLGQFGSRAALITSGEYLRVELPGFLVGTSAYQRSLGPAQAMFERAGEGSAISKPYFSALSVAVEFGVTQSLLLLGVLAYHVRRNLRLTASPLGRVCRTGLAANTGLGLLVLCCTVENYLEFPQAIFVPLLLYTIAISRANVQLAGDASPPTSDALGVA